MQEIYPHRKLSGFLSGRLICKKLKIEWQKQPDKMTKEHFKKLIGKRNRIEILPELLSNYCIEHGTNRSRSFRYFVEKVNTLE